MLSHLVGTTNRADIRRLQQLEADNAALAAKVERRQLHENFVERDRTIRELNELLSTRLGSAQSGHLTELPAAPAVRRAMGEWV